MTPACRFLPVPLFAFVTLFASSAVLAATGAAEASRWQAALDRVNPAVVVLRVSVPRAEDEVAAKSLLQRGAGAIPITW